MVDILAGFDYDKIKEKIKSLCESKDFKVVIIDSAGNVVSDISLSTLIDALRGTDNRTLTDLFNKAYDSTNDRQKISIENDAVGLAKDSTIIDLRDSLKGPDNKDFSTLEADVEGIKTQIDKLQFDANNLLRIALAAAEILQPTEIQSHWGEGVTLLASGARTSSGEGSDVDVERFLYGELHLSVTAVSGTFDTSQGLRVIVEGKDEITGDYKIIYDSADPEKSNIGEMITSPVDDWLPITMNAFKHLRVRWEISGTDPSFTFSVTMQAKA